MAINNREGSKETILRNVKLDLEAVYKNLEILKNKGKLTKDISPVQRRIIRV